MGVTDPLPSVEAGRGESPLHEPHALVSGLERRHSSLRQALAQRRAPGAALKLIGEPVGMNVDAMSDKLDDERYLVVIENCQ